jgi:hypothetical protein
MSGLRPILRARSFQVLWWAGLLLGLGSLVVVSLEGVSFVHEHVGYGYRLYHHHLFFGAHEHSHPHPDHPSKGRGKPRRTATVSAEVTLFHPVVANALAPPRMDPVAAVADLALPCWARPEPRSGPPRAPPVFPRCPR